MKFKYSFCYVLYSPRASIWSSFYCSMTIVSIFRGGDLGNLAGWYSYFFGTIIRHTRVVFNIFFTLFFKFQVTGSNKGIGFAIVRALCKNFDGDVFLTCKYVSMPNTFSYFCCLVYINS